MGKTRQIVGPVLIWLMVAATIGALTDVPAWSAELFETVAVEPWVNIGPTLSTVTMLVLVGLYGVMLLRKLILKDHVPFVRLVVGGAATTLVYAINKLILKDTYGMIRPCHTFDTGGSCPDISNFSYPSNHTVIAFGLAMGLAFAITWLSYLVFPVAILEAISRVLAGHHYPHDVLVGAVVGAFTVIGLLYMFINVQTAVAEKLTAARDKIRLER